MVVTRLLPSGFSHTRLEHRGGRLDGERRLDPVGFQGGLAYSKRVSEIPGKKSWGYPKNNNGATLIEKYRDFFCKTPPLIRSTKRTIYKRNPCKTQSYQKKFFRNFKYCNTKYCDIKYCDIKYCDIKYCDIKYCPLNKNFQGQKKADYQLYF